MPPRGDVILRGIFIGGGDVPYRKVSYAEQCWYILRYRMREIFHMPRIPDHPCAHPGCPKLVSRGKKYCDIHMGMHPEEIRSASKRGYTSKWNRARKRFLEKHPLCVQCMKEGRYVKATDVDHIIPHRGDPILFWDETNWQPFCHSCHSIKTRNEDEFPVYHY